MELQPLEAGWAHHTGSTCVSAAATTTASPEASPHLSFSDDTTGDVRMSTVLLETGVDLVAGE